MCSWLSGFQSIPETCTVCKQWGAPRKDVQPPRGSSKMQEDCTGLPVSQEDRALFLCCTGHSKGQTVPWMVITVLAGISSALGWLCGVWRPLLYRLITRHQCNPRWTPHWELASGKPWLWHYPGRPWNPYGPSQLRHLSSHEPLKGLLLGQPACEQLPPSTVTDDHRASSSSAHGSSPPQPSE